MTIKLLNSVANAIFILLIALIISNINHYKLVVITEFQNLSPIYFIKLYEDGIIATPIYQKKNLKPRKETSLSKVVEQVRVGSRTQSGAM